MNRIFSIRKDKEKKVFCYIKRKVEKVKEKDIEKKDWIQSWDLYRRHQKGLTGTPLLCNTYISEWQDFSSNPIHILATPPKVFCAVQLFYPWPGEQKKERWKIRKEKIYPFLLVPKYTNLFLLLNEPIYKWKSRLSFLFLGLTFSREPNLCNKMKSAAASFILQSFKWVISSLSLFL